MKQTLYLVLITLFGACTFLGAQATVDNFAMSMAPAATELQGPPGAVVSADIEVDLLLNHDIDNMTGWSLGVMVDPASALDITITGAVLSDDLQTVNKGGAPGFNSSSLFEAATPGTALGPCAAGCADQAADAITQAIIIDMMMGDWLDAAETDDFVMLTLLIHVEGTVGAIGDPLVSGGLVYTSAFGDPATETLCVHGGNSYAPAIQEGMTISLVPVECIPASQMTINIEDAAGAPEDVYTTKVILDFDADANNPNTDTPIQGWSYGLCVADAAKITIDSAELGADTAVAKDGAEPGFVSLKVGEVFNNEGLTLGVVVDMMSQISVPAQNGWEDLIVTGTVLMTEEEDSSYITPCNEALGDPATPNVMVIDGNSVYASSFEGTDAATADLCDPAIFNKPGMISVEGKPLYAPGDVNNDAGLNLADGIYILNALFREGPPIPCLAAADFNGDNVVDVSDAVGLIYWQFQPIGVCPDDVCPGPVLGLGCARQDTMLPCDNATACE